MTVEWGTSPRGYREKKREELRERVRWLRAQGIAAATAGETAPDSAGSTVGKSPVGDSRCAQTPTNEPPSKDKP